MYIIYVNYIYLCKFFNDEFLISEFICYITILVFEYYTNYKCNL